MFLREKRPQNKINLNKKSNSLYEKELYATLLLITLQILFFLSSTVSRSTVHRPN